MTIAEKLTTELEQESATTRRVLERVPESRLLWTPHEKSMTLGQLAFHIARLPAGIVQLVSTLDVGIPDVPVPQPTSTSECIAELDRGVAVAVEALAGWGDDGFAATWRMRDDGVTLIEMPREAVIRTLLLNHTFHHRGQLTIYLRLLDVPLPSVYGPTADERPF